jgi:hypothetical protein
VARQALRQAVINRRKIGITEINGEAMISENSNETKMKEQ